MFVRVGGRMFLHTWLSCIGRRYLHPLQILNLLGVALKNAQYDVDDVFFESIL